jgi:hypothetical protein
MKHLTVIALLLIALLALSSAALAAPLEQSETATPTVTYTPIATRTSTPAPFTSTGYTLTSGNKLQVENRATMGETLIVIVLLGLGAILLVRFVYDLAYQWGK